MSRLLDDILTAHGGLVRWQRATAVSVHGRFGGLLRWRFPGNRLAKVVARVQMDEQHTILRGFPQEAQQAVFDRGDVRIETSGGDVISARRDARAAFSGVGALRRSLRWDALDAAYFVGYAVWNYLSTPLLLTRDGVTVTEGDPWPEADELWRRLEVSFPREIETHSRRQTYYVDEAGLIRRHDYVAEVIGSWARAAHYCADHRSFAGLVFPTHRRVRPRGPGGRTLSHPTLVALDIDHIDVEEA